MHSSLIKIPQPKEPLPFTGERYTSAVGGQIQHEHLHRYLFALEFCEQVDVLDVACGEGYGTSALGQVARTAIGVDNAPGAIDHAQRCYATQNVTFKWAALPACP
jgi:protein-L-isoaspartate O-methyltransferase